MSESHADLMALCAKYRETEIGKLYCKLLQSEADRRLRDLESADDRHFPRLQGGIQSLRELHKRITTHG